MVDKDIPLRRLGKDGPSVPAVGFGLASMSYGYGTIPNDEERFRILDRSVELGETFWDTSDAYGDSEEFLGKWFARTGKRNEIFLASKFGLERTKDGTRINSTGEHCRKACKASLDRMGIDCLDLYYVHRVNHDTPIEETMRTMAELQREGKIKHIGLSEISSTTLRRACKIATVAAVQMEYSPFVLDIETSTGTNILKTCRELGVAVVSYSPLGRGMITGAFANKELVNDANDTRPSMFPRFQEENINANMELVSQFKAFADKKGCSTSQLAIAWLLKQGDDIIPLFGTKKIKYLEDNLGSLNVHLTDDEEAEIRKFVEENKMSGHRSSILGKSMIFSDTKEEA